MCHNSDNTMHANKKEQKEIVTNANIMNENELDLNKPHENLIENNGGQQAGPELKTIDISKLNIKINAEKKKVFEPVKDTAISINADLQKNRYLMESVDIISTSIPIEIERLKTYTNELSSVTRSKLAHDINRALKPIIDMLEKPIGSTDNKAVIRLMNILASHLDVAMEKCSTYLLTKKPRTSNGKDNYEKVHDTFCLVNVFQRLAKQKAMDIENAGKNLDSMFKSDTTFAGLLSKRDYINGNDISQLIEDENQTNITLKSDKKFVVKEQKNIGIEQMHAQALARLIGLDHTVTDYDLMMVEKGKDSYVYGVAKQVGKGNTIGELLEQGKLFSFSKEANAQLFKLQIWDILTGNIHDMKDIQVSYTLPKENWKHAVYVDKIIGYGDRISFTGNTFTDLDTLEFKHIDPEMVKNLKALKANTYFIDSMKLTVNHKNAFMTRLDALIKKIDSVTEKDKNVQSENFEPKCADDYAFDYRGQFKDLFANQVTAAIPDDKTVARTYSRDIGIKLLDNSNFKGGLTQREDFNRNNKDSKINRAFSKASYFTSTYLMFPLRLATKAVYSLAGLVSKGLKDLDQKDIIENRIPGKLLEDSKFDEGLAGKVEDEGDNQEIIDDSRMVPLAFEEAVPINENEPPYVSIKIDQPTEGTDKTGAKKGFSHGHVMLEMEYTRMNNGHKQRYRTRFGFYPLEGYDAFGPSTAEFTNGLVVPGMVANDKGHKYNVGRRFNATNKQINKLILFTNSFADKGGYNYITRSCASFAVDALKHAGVGNADLFHKNMMGKGVTETVGAFFDNFLPISTTASLFGNFYDRDYGRQDGKTYQKVGQKHLTQKEYERLFVTNRVEGWAYTPGFLGENIRAYDSKDDNDIIMADINIGKDEKDLLELLSNEQDTLLNFLNTEYKDKIDRTLLSDINRDIKQLANEIKEKYNVDYDDNEYIQKAGQIRGDLKALAELINNTIKYVSKVYNITLERDKKASLPFHHFVSNLWGLLDYVIAKNDEADLDAMNVQDKQMVRDAFNGMFYVGTKENPEEALVSMPLMIGLLEIYGSYQTLVEKISRYNELASKADRTDAENEEVYEINDDLEMAKNFISGHKYYYNSKNVTSDLATIAFNKLPKLLNESKMQINKDSKRASESLQSFDGPEQLYQYFAFDKLFKPGEKSKAKVPDKTNFNPDDMSGYISEFDSFAATIADEKPLEFKMILNALLAGNTGISKEAFCNEFKNAIINSYLRVEFSQVFDNKIKNEPNRILKDNYNSYFRKCFDDSHASLGNIMKIVGDYYDNAPKVKKDKKEDKKEEKKEKAPDKMARIEDININAFNEEANEKNKEKIIGIGELKYEKQAVDYQMQALKARHDEYVANHANVFRNDYMASVGADKYVKTLHLKKLGLRKGLFSGTYVSLSEKAKRDDIEEINLRKLKNRKGLHNDDEGTFSNTSDKAQLQFFTELKKICGDLCDLDYATPEFIKAINTIDAYITAENYNDQQKALDEALKALTKYVQSTKETDNNYELFLVTKAVDIKQRLENRTNGTLEIPEEQREEALRVRRNPKPGWFGTYTSVRKMRLFPHDPSPNDIKQRTTSDCYMMSALCSIAASQPEIIKQRMKDNGDTVTVKFFEKGTTNPVYITVKKEIPTYMLKVQKNAVDSLWVQMIEKAFAVYYGNAKVRDRRKEAGDDDGSRSYAALDYQDSFVFLSRFLGPDYSYENAKSLITLPEVITEDTIIENEDEQFKGIRIYNASMSDEYSGVATRLHEEWKKRLDSREVITVGISRNAENVAEAASKGYHTEHAYAVLKVFDVKVNKTGKTRRYVRLRDPYGAYSSDYDENKNKAVSTGNSFFMFDSTETMGTFDVEWNEFLNTFDNYCGCKVAACGSLVTAKVAEMASVKEKEIEDKMKKVQRDKIIQGQNNNANKIDDAGDDF